MPLQKIGLNLTNIQNITVPNFDFKNTSTEFINDIPAKANEISKGYLGLFSLVPLFIYLMWKLNQNISDGGDYGYNKSRSIGIASSICSIIGLYCLNIGYFNNFFFVAIFIIVSFISVGIVYKSAN